MTRTSRVNVNHLIQIQQPPMLLKPTFSCRVKSTLYLILQAGNYRINSLKRMYVVGGREWVHVKRTGTN